MTEATTASTTSKSRQQRTYKKPEAVEMDMNSGGKPFREFARETGPESHRDKYLVAAAWLHNFANIKTISADHVWTCYLTADWTFNIKDPTQMFRVLKRDGLGTTKDGTFSINHV